MTSTLRGRGSTLDGQNGAWGLPPHEIQRKVIHLGSSILPLLLFYLPPETGITVAAAALILAIAVDVVRLRVPSVQAFFHEALGTALRPHEASELTGSTFLCLAALVCIVLFPVPIAVTALFFLTIGDTAAALIGQRWGRTPLMPGKTLEGTLACLVTCLLVSIAVPGVPFLAGFVGAVVATIVELFGTAAVDDNFGIPVLSALVMWIVASLVG
jgi:dolichol kinase